MRAGRARACEEESRSNYIRRGLNTCALSLEMRANKNIAACGTLYAFIIYSTPPLIVDKSKRGVVAACVPNTFFFFFPLDYY